MKHPVGVHAERLRDYGHPDDRADGNEELRRHLIECKHLSEEHLPVLQSDEADCEDREGGECRDQPR